MENIFYSPMVKKAKHLDHFIFSSEIPLNEAISTSVLDTVQASFTYSFVPHRFNGKDPGLSICIIVYLNHNTLSFERIKDRTHPSCVDFIYEYLKIHLT